VTPVSREQVDGAPPTAVTVACFEDVTKVYQMGATEVRALAGVSVSFKVGEFWAIMGPSGSGKSTMLNLLGCLDRPTSGRYLLEEQDVAALNDDALSEFRLRHLGFVFQSFNLIPQLTVRENIELALQSRRGLALLAASGQRRQLADRYIRELGIKSPSSETPVANLSGGNQQKVLLARWLATAPRLLILDEPTRGIDVAAKAEIIRLITELRARGMAILFISSELEEVTKACARVIVLRDRRTVAELSGGDITENAVLNVIAQQDA